MLADTKANDEAKPASVTVIIPAYNAEQYLERTLRSAVAQTYPGLQILVINDGSTDGTAALLDCFSRKFENVRCISVNNGGVARARNLGTEMADTDYVAYLDADDLWHPSKIEKQVAVLEKHSGDPTWAAVYTLSRRIDEADRVICDGPSHSAKGAFFESHLLVNHVGNGSALLVRRDVALEIGGWDPSLADRGIGGCEDLEFQLRILQRYKMDVVREFLVGYRVYDGNMSSKHLSMARSHLAVIQKFVTDPRVDMRLRKAALGRSHRYAWARLIVGGDKKGGISSYFLFFRAEPLQALLDLAPKIVNRFRRLGVILSPMIRPFEREPELSARFLECDPRDGVLAAEAQPIGDR